MAIFRRRSANERKAMFANMLNSRYHPMVRFAEEAKPIVETKLPDSASYEFKSELPEKKVNLDEVPKLENIKFDESFYGKPKVETILQEEHWDNEPGDEIGLNVGTPPIVLPKKDDLLERIGTGFYSGLERGEKKLESNVIAEAGKLGSDIGSLEVLKYPGRELKSLHIPQQLEKYTRYGIAVALPAAEAFGATAGVGVTEALRATGNLITDPGREFYIPPGYQRVWSGMGDNYKLLPISTPQMQPAHFVAGMGAAMPPGVSAEPMDIAEFTRGEKSAPLFRQIEDKGKSAEVRMGTMEAGKIMERERVPRDVMSPKERIARMGVKESAEAFMGGRGGGRMQEGAGAPLMYSPKTKSDKQVRIEAIVDMPIMQAAEAFEKNAKVEISRPSAPVYVQQRQMVPTIPVRVEIPLSSNAARRVMV